ncbi:MAG: dihydropteroate synthase [SAR324 cluster bacterium]|nr:dihydropteroate synthase [SAR324 cluster bacterium]
MIFQSPPYGGRRPGATPAAITPEVPWQVGAGRWDFSRPLIMGVLNVTPDSFSDGGAYLEPERALSRAKTLWAEGAHLIDLGGASSHPLAAPVAAEEELARIAPVLERLMAEVPLPVSVDTQNPRVAEAALGMGAHLINDVSGMIDPAMPRLAGKHGVPLVITYNNLTVPKEASGLSFISDMLAFFDERIDEAEGAGATRILLDPGYGFGKTLEENLTVLRSLPLLRRFNRPLLICTSRKGSLGRLVGEAVPKERLGASVASSLYAAQQGAQMIRVHDVKAFRQALDIWRAIHAVAGEDEADGTSGPR